MGHGGDLELGLGPVGPGIERLIEDDISILHLKAELPATKTRPKVVIGSMIPLSQIEPADASRSTILIRQERAPAIRAREFALTSVTAGEGGHDEGGVEA